MKNQILDIETKVNIEVGSILEKLIQLHNRRDHLRRFDKNRDDCENENCLHSFFTYTKVLFI